MEKRSFPRPSAVRERIRRQPRLLQGLLALALLLAAAVLQTLPGFLCVGGARPAFLLPLCLAFALFHSPLAGALFGAAGGLVWELCSGRPCGFLALCLVGLCLVCGCWLRPRYALSAGSFFFVALAGALALFSVDFLFFFWMQNYSGALRHYLTVCLPCALLTALAAPFVYCLLEWLLRRFSAR